MRVIPDVSSTATTNAQVHKMEVDAAKTAKLYMMMSSNLYADKHMSILRELCSNAQDSHCEAGKLDTPFVIIAPTSNHPFMTISDCGVGMDYETAKRTILMFLGSTKDSGDNADEYIGGWGVGAKSPRSYTKDYQIIARKHGVEYTIQVFDIEGEPNSVLMSKTATTKPDGLDFVLPVQQIDITLWRSKIAAYMSNTNYNVAAYMGNGEVVFPTAPKASIDYGDFCADIYGEVLKYETAQKAVSVTYGGMRYEIPYSFNLRDITDSISKQLANGIELRIRVNKANKLTFGLSRESIETTDANVAFVRNALLRVEEDIKGNVKDRQKTLLGDVNKTVVSWEEVLELDEQVRKVIEQEGDSKFMAYVKKVSRSATWRPMCLKQETYNGGLGISGGQFYHLPLEKEAKVREIPVLWSTKRPLQKDWVKALKGGNGFVLHEPVKSEEEALERAESEKGLKGCILVPVEVKSSRGYSSRGTGANSGSIFAVCQLTGQRKKIVEGITYVTVKDKSQMWLDAVFNKIVTFVPTPTFLKREDVPDNVLTYEELFEDEEFKASLKENLQGWHTSLEDISHLRTASRVVEKFRKGPLKLVEEASEVAFKLSNYAAIAENSKKNTYTLTEEQKANLPVDSTYDSNVKSLLEKANEICYIFSKYKNLFSVVDFGTISCELRRGNPEAKRLVTAMALEQFYE